MRLALALLAAFLAAFLAAHPLAAQTVLEAVVTDAETGAPLAGATVQAPDGTGAATDARGRVRLTLAHLPAEVVVRFLGYRTDTLRVEREPGESGVLRRVVRLAPAAVPLDDVTVTDENPAVGILRRVLARKAVLRRAMPEYAAEDRKSVV